MTDREYLGHALIALCAATDALDRIDALVSEAEAEPRDMWAVVTCQQVREAMEGAA